MSGSANRAQSESLSSLLLVAVVVISVGTFGAYYIASTTDGSAGNGDSPDDFDFTVEMTEDELRVSHNGGPSAAAADLRLTVENASGEYTFAFDEGTIQAGDGNGRFDPGETWRLTWDQSPDTEVTIALVDVGENQLLFRTSATVEPTVTERPAISTNNEPFIDKPI